MREQAQQPKAAPPLLVQRLPNLAVELKQGLHVQGEVFLADSVEFLRIYSLCGCSDTTCGSFYTGPRPDDAFGPNHRCIPLDPSKGMTILDIVDDVIRYVELINRPDIYAALHSNDPMAP